MKENTFTPEKLMAKAEEFVSGARLMLEAGNINVAASNAYYAIFHAARAALLASDAIVELEKIRTHNGLIGTFGETLFRRA